MLIKIQQSKNTMTYSGKIIFTQSLKVAFARERLPIKAALVGFSRFVNPSPNWKDKIET